MEQIRAFRRTRLAHPIDEPPRRQGEEGQGRKPRRRAPAAPPAPRDGRVGGHGARPAPLRAREQKDQLVAMREELAATLEEAKDPIVGPDLAKARGILSRMSDKVGEGGTSARARWS